MKRVGLGIVCLLLLTPIIVAQGAKPAKPVPVQTMALYKKSGRSWTHRIIHSIRGESPVVETSTTRITKLEDGRAHCTTETESRGGRRVSTSRFQVDVDEVPAEAKHWAAAETVEILDTGFGKLTCRKHQEKTDTRQTTTWVSADYHPLVVKQVIFEGELTSIRKLTAFNAADVDPWQLYRKEGRRWKTKTTIQVGGNATTSYTEYKIKEVSDSAATFTLSTLDANGKAMFSQDQEITFTENAVYSLGSAEAKMETKTCAAGEFKCYVSDMDGTKSWSSVAWPGLMVAMDSKSFSIELVEFDVGHDPHFFYRTKGNNYTIRAKSRFAGNVTETTTRFEVIEVTEESARVKVTLTETGLPAVESERQHDFPKEETPTVWAGEPEEMIETAAGTFPALLEESEGAELWMWNGLPVRIVQTDEHHTFEGELIELNLQ